MGGGVKMDEGSEASAGVACVAIGSWTAVACIVGLPYSHWRLDSGRLSGALNEPFCKNALFYSN